MAITPNSPLPQNTGKASVRQSSLSDLQEGIISLGRSDLFPKRNIRAEYFPGFESGHIGLRLFLKDRKLIETG